MDDLTPAQLRVYLRELETQLQSLGEDTHGALGTVIGLINRVDRMGARAPILSAGSLNGDVVGMAIHLNVAVRFAYQGQKDSEPRGRYVAPRELVTPASSFFASDLEDHSKTKRFLFARIVGMVTLERMPVTDA